MKIQPMMNQVVGGLGLDGLVGQTSNDASKIRGPYGDKNKLNQNALNLGKNFVRKGPLDKFKK